MSFARKVWHLLVAIKDGLSLVFLLLFFMALYAVLTARPSPAQVREGALLLELDGYVVEEKSEVDPLAMLIGGEAPLREFQARDLIHAVDTAASDDRVKAIVLDLSRFLGGGPVHLQEIGAALDRARAAEKPVLAYAIGYGDDALLLAAHASEVWVDPMGGAVIAGPGGERPYYAELIEKLRINAHVYRVGTYKAAVEPYSRSGMSEESRENISAIYAVLWEEWQAHVRKARPAADIAKVTSAPAEWIAAAQGDLAGAALEAGLVDKLGSRVEFGQRVAEIAGDDPWDKRPGRFAHSRLDPWLADNPLPQGGKPIGVVTIAGEIVDGDAGPGTAGGERIAELLDEALEEDLAGLVVRVDSPGGSVLASEEIRLAILRHKARGIPIAVSMANLAASGGYWVATPADRIFAEPETITGSIGIFAVVPTFERTAQELGITTDGVRTTPLSGQPDLVAGFTPEVDAILQSTTEDGYRDFIRLVAGSRKLTPARVDEIGQGRVWDGGTARQIGLVDQYGGLDEALAWTAAKAGIEKADGWHARFLGADRNQYDTIIRSLMLGDDARQPHAQDVFALFAHQQQDLATRLLGDLDRLMGQRGLQAYCLECPPTPRAARVNRDTSWLAGIAAILR